MAKTQHNQSIVGFLKTIHTRIQKGDGGLARIEFLRFLRDRFDPNNHRIHLAEVASLCRRLGEYERAIRLIRPLINAEKPKRTTATPEEQAQYAACLMSMGAVGDGFKILQSIQGPSTPEAHLFTAFGHMLRNHYNEATAPLRKFIEDPAPTHYQKIVAQTNLIQVLVYLGDTEETDQLLPELLRITEQENFKLLHGNLLESSVHQEFWRGNIAQAEERLDQAQQLHHQSGDLRRFYIKQWRAILDLKQSGATQANLNKLRQVQQEARELSVFGIIRECDIALAHVTQDERLWQHLLFGIPPGSQHSRIERLSGMTLSTQSQYTWLPEQSPLYAPGITLQLSTGRILPSGPNLKTGQVLHRLISIFTNDFYRPLRVGEIHEALFPEKFYHPRASPLAVRQALFRLRHWFSGHGLPFEIRESGGTYRLTGHSNGGIVIQAASRVQASGEEFSSVCLVQKLKESGVLSSKKDLQTQEAATALGVSLATARRQLKEAFESGQLQRKGAGRSTRYCLPK